MPSDRSGAPPDLAPVLAPVLGRYPLPLDGLHGVGHWARVLENGRRLVPETGADGRVVDLFAVLHDSRRETEGHDPDHGPRAAEFAAALRGTAFELDDAAFELLRRACAGHTHERTHPDATVRTCWDADRLDLGRCATVPHPDRLCTDAAKRPETINWAYGRGAFGVVPALVRDEWGIDLK